ncbi:MAG TPA: hypothetical protein VL977_05120 [Solirubrobacteraceae bacterium]|nr:hypothetical protein [Solirubrobacteraceae bacterium]
MKRGAGSTSRAGQAGGAAGSARGARGGDLESHELAYARCMRAHGVAAFPDPSPGGGFDVHAGSGVDPTSSAYRRADARCGALLPGGGAGPSFNPRAGSQLLRIATCMHRHGFAAFPEPRRAPGGALPAPPPG